MTLAAGTDAPVSVSETTVGLTAGAVDGSVGSGDMGAELDGAGGLGADETGSDGVGGVVGGSDGTVGLKVGVPVGDAVAVAAGGVTVWVGVAVADEGPAVGDCVGVTVTDGEAVGVTVDVAGVVTVGDGAVVAAGGSGEPSVAVGSTDPSGQAAEIAATKASNSSSVASACANNGTIRAGFIGGPKASCANTKKSRRTTAGTRTL